MRFHSFLFIALAACLLLSCGETSDSPSLQQARAIHSQLNDLSGKLHDAMQESLVVLERQMESSLQAGDSALAMQLARIESQLGELDVRFHDWNETVVGIPGDVCDHEGHDHGHDHGNELSLEGMTDAQILEIQEALMVELAALQQRYDSIESKLSQGLAQ